MPAYRKKTGVVDIIFLDSLIEGYRLNQPLPLTIKAHSKVCEAIYHDQNIFFNAVGTNKDSAVENFKMKIVQLYEQYRIMEENEGEIQEYLK